MVPNATALVRRRPPSAQDRVRAVLGILHATHGDTIKLRQDEIGRLADCGRETASRALAVLEREGTIRQGRGSVAILDPSKLEGGDDAAR